ncbi:MAG: transposase, partial [Elusimicrobia bacterium]|nr:transposase [Elusimicrobiota bacterium]
ARAPLFQSGTFDAGAAAVAIASALPSFFRCKEFVWRPQRLSGYTWSEATMNQIIDGIRGLSEVAALSSAQAKALLEQACLRHGLRCPRCANSRCSRLRSGRIRCPSCARSFPLFAGRWLERPRITARSWLTTLKCLELDVRGAEGPRFAGLSDPVFYRALEAARRSLAAQDPAWKALAAEPQAQTEVFGVRRGGPEGGDALRIEPVSGGEELLRRAVDAGVRHSNGFVYLSGCDGYDALVCHGTVLRESGIAAGRGRVAGDPFLNFLINRTRGHFGIRRAVFPLYLKEQEYRFNGARESLWPRLLSSITSYR